MKFIRNLSMSEIIGQIMHVKNELEDWNCKTEQKKVTEPITAFSATAQKPSDIPDFFAKAFSIFKSQRPRPVHISIPLDVQSQPVVEEWLPVEEIERQSPKQNLIVKAVEMLKRSKKPP